MPRTRFLLVLAGGLALYTPAAVQAQEGRTPRLDRFGDPLPVGALARLGTLRFHRCSCFAYSPSGKSIATADSDEANLWDVATSRKIRRLPIEGRSAAGLIFSHDGKKLAVVGFGGEFVQLWDLDSFKMVRLVQAEGGSGGGDWSHAAAFSSDDKTLFAATSTRLFLWDVASGKKLKEYPFRGKGRAVWARLLAFSEDGKVVATGSDKRVHLWDTHRGQLLHEIPLFQGGGDHAVLQGR